MLHARLLAAEIRSKRVSVTALVMWSDVCFDLQSSLLRESCTLVSEYSYLYWCSILLWNLHNKYIDLKTLGIFIETFECWMYDANCGLKNGFILVHLKCSLGFLRKVWNHPNDSFSSFFSVGQYKILFAFWNMCPFMNFKLQIQIQHKYYSILSITLSILSFHSGFLPISFLMVMILIGTILAGLHCRGRCGNRLGWRFVGAG